VRRVRERRAGPGRTMEVPTLIIFRRERSRPADDIFAHPGCPQPVPARSPRPGPGPAGKARPSARAGRAARRRDRRDRGLEVVRRDRPVGRRCRPGRPGCPGRGPWPGGRVHLPAGIRTGQRGMSSIVLSVPGCTPGPCGPQAGWSSPSTARRSAVRGTGTGRRRAWSRRWRTASARSSGRSPWTRRATRSPRSGNC
jgi:hypothetical protein